MDDKDNEDDSEALIEQEEVVEEVPEKKQNVIVPKKKMNSITEMLSKDETDKKVKPQTYFQKATNFKSVFAASILKMVDKEMANIKKQNESGSSESSDSSESTVVTEDTEEEKLTVEQMKENQDEIKIVYEEYMQLNSGERHQIVKDYFRSPASKFMNYTETPFKERMKVFRSVFYMLKQNIYNIDYIKDIIYTSECPKKPKFTREVDELGKITMDTVVSMEEGLEIFSEFYLGLMGEMPDALHKQANINLLEKTMISNDLLKKVKKRIVAAKEMFRNMDLHYGEVFSDLTLMQCDMKDMMSFYHLLPRFVFVYKEILPEIKAGDDAYVKYWIKKLKDFSFNWRIKMKGLYKNLHFINFFMVLSKMFFDFITIITDPLELLPIMDVYMNIYNMVIMSLSTIVDLRKNLIRDFKELKKYFDLIENNKNLVSMPFPVFNKFPTLFSSVSNFWIIPLILVFFLSN